MSRLAVVAALPGELKPLVAGWSHERRNGVDLWRTDRDGREWLAACAGAGAGAAARALAALEQAGKIDLVVSAGWAGALRDGFAPGSAFPVHGVIDARTNERFEATAASADLAECWVVTVERVADAAQKTSLARSHGVALVDMEASAVARWAAAHGAAFACIKGVSDGPGDRLPDFNRFISADGAFQTGRFVLYALVHPGYWPSLIRLGRWSRQAADAMAKYLLDLLTQQGKRF